MFRNNSGFNRARRRRRTVVTVSNRVPKISPIVKPLNFGAGGCSSTFRAIFPVYFLLKNSDVAAYDSFTWDITVADIVFNSGIDKLAAQYNEFRVLQITAKAQTLVSFSKGMGSWGMMLKPFRRYKIRGGTNACDGDWMWDDAIGYAPLYAPRSSVWRPSSPKDVDYHKIPKTTFPNPCTDTTDVVYSLFLAYRGVIPSQFPVVVIKGTTYYWVANITLDMQLTFRGRTKPDSHVAYLVMDGINSRLVSSDVSVEAKAPDIEKSIA